MACFHCGLPIPSGSDYSLAIDGTEQAFCCPACMGVAEAIVTGGLSNYYRYRNETGVRPEWESAFTAYDNPQFQRQFVTHQGESAKAQLLITGIHCAACIWLLEHHIGELDGVTKVSVNLSDHRAVVEWNPATRSLREICQAIADIGYLPEPYSPDQLANYRDQENRTALRRLGVAGIGMMQVGMFAIALYAGAMQGIEEQYRDLMRVVSLLISIPVVFFAARPFFIGAWRGIKTRSPGMDLPVATAIGLAFIASAWATFNQSGEVYFDSIAMFTFLLLIGRYMEMRARHYHGRLNTDLYSLLPSTAIRIGDDGSSETVPLLSVVAGEMLLVKPGQTLPADGVIIHGDSSLSEAALTGEFLPQRKSVGDAVSAGSVNGDSPLTIRVTAVGDDLQINTIRHLADEAQNYKPRLAQLADRISSLFVLVVLGMALLTYLSWHFFSSTPEHAFWIALSVLVVSCPCALSLATPTALTAATSALRQSGLLVTSGTAWEGLPNVTDIVFDKTGTLTEGKLTIQQVVTLTDADRDHCLAVAAALESHSEHPIASAFITYRRQTLSAQQVEAVVGFGIQGDIQGHHYRIGRPDFAITDHSLQQPDSDNQWLLLSRDQQPLAWFALNDTLRDDTQQTVTNLKQRGYTVHLLSGDSSGQAEILARQLHFNHCRAGVTPAEKLDYLRELQTAHKTVLMVGDGINDIPVLAAADISVAMSGASDLAKTHADCIMLGNHLNMLPHLLQTARKTRRIVRQNLSWSLIYNLSALPLAAMGWVPPYLAAIGMSLSSLGVVLNSLRLNRNRNQ